MPAPEFQPDQENAILLDHRPPEFLNALSRIGSAEIRARHPGATLSKHVVETQPLVALEGEGGQRMAVLPEHGLIFSLDVVKSAHGLLRNRGVLCPVLQMNFADQSNGLSFTMRPGTPAADAWLTMMRDFGWLRVPLADLDGPASHANPAGAMRPFETRRHAIYGILRHAVSLRLPLHCRLASAHADLTTWLIASKIEVADGWVQCWDYGNALQIDAAKCLGVDLCHERLDGECFSVARFLGADGAEMLRIGVRDAGLLQSWRRISAAAADWIADGME